MNGPGTRFFPVPQCNRLSFVCSLSIISSDCCFSIGPKKEEKCASALSVLSAHLWGPGTAYLRMFGDPPHSPVIDKPLTV